MTLNPHQRAAIRNETVVAVVINAVIITGLLWLAGIAPPAALRGADGLLAGMAKGAGIPTFLMTLIATKVIRGRVRATPALALPRADLPAPLRALPDNVVLRAVAMALVAIVALVAVGAVVATLLGIVPLDGRGFVIFNIVFGAVVGLATAPIVVLRALADGRA
jgi:hypothetical protein